MSNATILSKEAIVNLKRKRSGVTGHNFIFSNSEGEEEEDMGERNKKRCFLKEILRVLFIHVPLDHIP